MTRMIFVNLPVSDLPASMDFYAALGFENNPHFTDDTAACMVWSEAIHVMLLTADKWRSFTDRPIPPPTSSEVSLALSMDSREAVDAMNAAAAAHGGTADTNPVQDLGFMYGRDLADPDGHIWGPCWMDPAAMPPAGSLRNNLMSSRAQRGTCCFPGKTDPSLRWDGKRKNRSLAALGMTMWSCSDLSREGLHHAALRVIPRRRESPGDDGNRSGIPRQSPAKPAAVAARRPRWHNGRSRIVAGSRHMIEFVIEQRRRDLGSFEVGRVLPFAKRRMVGPYIFFDRMGPKDLAPGLPREADVRPHPHIGLSTITYLFDGEIMHRDSVGSEQAIHPGEVNWMTAGSGITHSERFERLRREGGPIDGIQAWVALPDEREEMDPGFWHYASEALPVFDGDGMTGRLIAGRLSGLQSPVRIDSPQFYVHWDLRAGARVSLPAEYPERAVYVARGAVEVDRQRVDAGSMAVLGAGKAVTVAALDDAVVMALGGEPVGPRYIDWNFVSSSKERIDQAREDWKAGRMKLPNLDHDEFIPLPPKLGELREPEPMS